MGRRGSLVLYLVSLLLVGLLVYVGLQLRARVWALRRRAALEHVLAGISMRFVTARGADIDTVVEQALTAISQRVGADRAYLLISGGANQTYTWCGHGISFPAGWPDQALVLLSQHNYPTFDGVVHIPSVARLPPGAARTAIAAADLQGWSCATGKTANGGEVLLGFDAVGHSCRMQAGELGLLRMTLDTIVNALGRRSLEQERARLSLRLEQARRLETVGTLASGIAHNFNNIIGAILGYVEFADEQDGSPRILDAIRKAGERARDLIDQILTFARRHDAHRSVVDIRSLTAETASLLRASLPAKVELAIPDAAEPVPVLGVAAQLQQAILNLCNNAAQAMDQAGRIELDITTIDLVAPKPLSNGTLVAGRYALIAVSDTGRGMDQAVLERIFEPFFTTRADGNGLGLATTRDIVREHSGAIHVQSTAGRGSRFEIWLPCLAAGTQAASAALPFGRGEAVLVVEADTERLLRDEEMLAALGYEPAGFSSVATAWAAYAASTQRFDLILLAHSASVTEMLELSTRLHELAPELPIVLATSAHDEFSAVELISAGIADVVPWPLAAMETAEALQDCLRRKQGAGKPDPAARQALATMPLPRGARGARSRHGDPLVRSA